MTAYANPESFSGTLIQLSNGNRDAEQKPNGSKSGDGTAQNQRQLEAAVSLASERLGQDLRSVGNQLLSIEEGHRTLMEQLQQIAARADERTVQQLQALQRQCEIFGQQLQLCEQGFKHELRSAEDRIQKSAADQHQVTEQRLRAIEPTIALAEQNWRQVDEWRQNAEHRFDDAQTQLQATVQQFQNFEQQLLGAVSEIKSVEPQIKSCEERLQRNTSLVFEAKKTFDEQAKRGENIVISIGSQAQQIEQLKGDFSQVSDRRLKSLQAMLKSNRRMQGLAMIAWSMSLLLVAYIGVSNGAWPFVAQHLGRWMPGSKQQLVEWFPGLAHYIVQWMPGLI